VPTRGPAQRSLLGHEASRIWNQKHRTSKRHLIAHTIQTRLHDSLTAGRARARILSSLQTYCRFNAILAPRIGRIEIACERPREVDEEGGTQRFRNQAADCPHWSACVNFGHQPRTDAQQLRSAAGVASDHKCGSGCAIRQTEHRRDATTHQLEHRRGATTRGDASLQHQRQTLASALHPVHTRENTSGLVPDAGPK
jgi:hypothetical protein